MESEQQRLERLKRLERLQTYRDSLPRQRKPFDMSDMILRDNSPHPLAYVATGGRTQNTHAGQMKLLLADEMSIMLGLRHICQKYRKVRQDLERDGGRAKVAVVVAGAAPGDHFEDLSKTFGFVDFHLYDPAPRWHPSIHRKNLRPRNVFIYPQKFEVKTAEEWGEKKVGDKQYEHVIFLSDLRIADAEFPTPKQVAMDMDLQKEMTESMKACYSVLKFRPRFYDETDPEAEKHRTLKYFDGTIYFQGYPPITSTETRLHVTDTKSVKSYDIEVYEKQLFYHNQITRNQDKVLFENFGRPGLSYDNAHARFVKNFLEYRLGQGSVSEGQRNYQHQRKFEHFKIRALLEELKLLST